MIFNGLPTLLGVTLRGGKRDDRRSRKTPEPARSASEDQAARAESEVAEACYRHLLAEALADFDEIDREGTGEITVEQMVSYLSEKTQDKEGDASPDGHSSSPACASWPTRQRSPRPRLPISARGAGDYPPSAPVSARGARERPHEGRPAPARARAHHYYYLPWMPRGREGRRHLGSRPSQGEVGEREAGESLSTRRSKAALVMGSSGLANLILPRAQPPADSSEDDVGLFSCFSARR